VAADLSGWTPRALPGVPARPGRHVRVVPFDRAAHPEPLFAALGGPGRIAERLRWFGRPSLDAPSDLHDWLVAAAADLGWVTAVFLPVGSETPCGMASFMRTDVKNGTTEIGAVAHGDAMARGPIATEAHYLLARSVFEEGGYRRYEWKLNDRNLPSHAAARRLGFRFEGVFRNHQVVHGPDGPESRDTAWYAMTDADWPVARTAFERWLDPANHDAQGRQVHRLWELRGSG
jgi:RimJ/RimL family protein N-acetyltransferase